MWGLGGLGSQPWCAAPPPASKGCMGKGALSPGEGLGNPVLTCGAPRAAPTPAPAGRECTGKGGPSWEGGRGARLGRGAWEAQFSPVVPQQVEVVWGRGGPARPKGGVGGPRRGGLVVPARAGRPEMGVGGPTSGGGTQLSPVAPQ